MKKTKAFDKWLDEAEVPPEHQPMGWYAWERGAQSGWRAALEWALSIDSGFCSCGCPNDSEDNPSVLHQIEEELK